MKNNYAKKKIWLTSIAVVTAISLMSGCGSKKNNEEAAGGDASGTPATGTATTAKTNKPLQKVTFAYAGGTCEAPIYTAIEQGFFKEEGLDVELVQQDFETLKSGISSGKVDATVGNFAWFKPIEQGLDVKLTGGLHAGCIQLVTPSSSGITSIKELKGKTVGVDVIGGGPQITLSIALKENGLDPEKDVQWRAYPAQQLSTAADKGEIQAFIVWDPAGQQAIDEKNYVSLLNTAHDDPFMSGYCCYSVISGKVAEEDPEKAAAITRALLKAAEWVGNNPQGAAEIETNKKYVSADVATNQALLASYTWKPGVKAAQDSAKFFIKNQKELGILDSSTDENELFDRLFYEAIPDYNGR
ncbi:ABC transporter substrate-binding protein [Cohnella sp. AR92]|uniref:ABC transporter substrate-binding protein n=1 Tax=Cohnella sp. AR92 TaxID=648716 RepID=UPI001315A039|nr:ABC transporter substrate-binding protein [Cohnella sp. AR92]